jgi:hypothetical protein
LVALVLVDVLDGLELIDVIDVMLIIAVDDGAGVDSWRIVDSSWGLGAFTMNLDGLN